MTEWIDTEAVLLPEPTAVVIGKFDGEHIGHQKLFRELFSLAERKALKTAVFTFHTSPGQILGGGHGGRLETNRERRERMRRAGVDYLIEYPFNRRISSMEGEAFLREILIRKLRMQAIVAGADCAFGYNKSENADLLRALSGELGYEVVIVEKEKNDRNEDISSSMIRDLLAEGDMETANRLLGYSYRLRGMVVRGNGLGKKILGMPTLNIYPEEAKHLPRLGVYATRVLRRKNGEIYLGLTNVGINPTVEEDKENHRIRVETYLYDFDEDIYGEEVTVSFYRFIREEKKFASMEELKEQMEKDKWEVRGYFENSVREEI